MSSNHEKKGAEPELIDEDAHSKHVSATTKKEWGGSQTLKDGKRGSVECRKSMYHSIDEWQSLLCTGLTRASLA